MLKIISSALLSASMLMAASPYYPLKNDTMWKKKIFEKAGCDKVYSNRVVDTCYSNSMKGALAVAYTINGKNVNEVNLKEREKWRENSAVPKHFRSSDSDYRKSGYDRGHLASDQMFDYDVGVLRETYDININSVPQKATINRNYWTHPENYSRTVAYKIGKVDVVDVMVYGKNPKRIGKNQIAVPEGFYKVLQNKEYNFERCFYYPNDESKARGTDMRKYVVECRDIVY